MKLTLKDLGWTEVPASKENKRNVNVACPICKDQHSKNKRRRCLSVNLDTGLYKCFRCNATGKLDGFSSTAPQEKDGADKEKPAYRIPRWFPEFINADSPQLDYLVSTRMLTTQTLKEMKISEPWTNMPRRETDEDTAPTTLTLGKGEQLSETAPSTPHISKGEQLRETASSTPHFSKGEHPFSKAEGEREYIEGNNPTTPSPILHSPLSIIHSPLTPNPTSALEQVIAFNYFLDGKLVNVKYRTIDKQFKMFGGGRVIPYNLDSVKGKSVCAITEGEIDAATLHQCGMKSVISVPTGGSARVDWIDEFWDTHFSDKRYFILALDEDNVGRKLLDSLTARLGADRCRIVHWSKGCKDANEELLAHGQESVLRWLELAVYPLMGNVFTAKDLRQELQDVYHNRIQHGMKVGLQGFDDLVSFELKRLVTITGKPGEGKSELVDELVVRLAVMHGWKTAFFSPENMPIALHLRKLAEKLTGFRFEPSVEMTDAMFEAVSRWLAANICHILPREDCYELDTILATARMLVERKGIRTLVIDPFNRIEQRLREGQTELQYISSVLNRLVRFAQQMNVMVILVAHPRKVNRSLYDGKARRVEMNDINGSADFANKSDICLAVDRNDEMEVTTVYVDKVRFKHLGKRGHCYFHYEVMNGRFHPCGIGKAMNRDGEVTDRYQNVSWQTDSWIRPDGTLIHTQPASGIPPAPVPASSDSPAPASSATHNDAMQQTLVFSEGEH